MGHFDYLAPKTLAEALGALQDRGSGAAVLAGGTDLLVQLKQRKRDLSCLISVGSLPELKGIRKTPDGMLSVGAATPLGEIVSAAGLSREAACLAEAARKVGSSQVRNLATLGGNLCNAAPSADTAPVLLVMEAGARIAGPGKERVVPLEHFFTGPGATVLQPGEILVAVEIPQAPAGFAASYIKHSVRRAMDIAFVGVAALMVPGADGAGAARVRIGLGAVSPTPMRARKAEAALEGQPFSVELAARAGEIAATECSPITDLRASAEYRREMVAVLTRRALVAAWESAQGGAAR
ncbi:MAG: FAD binding domain-containing protein [Firmicutes bacterium]|nr:FAD binding domain-containing protein [Bacillota bacterium]